MKMYLGDSVYVSDDWHGVIALTTENGDGPSNVIILEPEVLAAFDKFREARRAESTDLPQGKDK
jgi:hypothetical protein